MSDPLGMDRIDATPLSRRVLFQVRDRIIAGGLPANRWLRIADLAMEIGTSITPVRTALAELESQGLVQVAKARGFRVIPPTPQDIRDAYLMTGFLVGELNARAARAADATFVAECASIQERLESAIGGGSAAEVDAANWEFHRLIHVRAGAPRLARTLRVVTRSVPHDFHRLIAGWNAISIVDHRRMIAALAARDEDAARSAAVRHVTEGCESFLRSLAVADQTE